MKLYGCITQSEYIREIIASTSDEKEFPFFEIVKTSKNINYNLKTGQKNFSEENKEDSITNYNKRYMCDLIIKKAQYASQKLLQLAVAYRFCNDNYLDSTGEFGEKCKNEELRLIHEIIICVIKETNMKLKECKLNYNKNELNNGTYDPYLFKE